MTRRTRQMILEEARVRARTLVTEEVLSGGERYLRPYLLHNRGAQFEDSADSAHPNMITQRDLDALECLSVRVTVESADRLLSEHISEALSEKLAMIPTDLALEDVPEPEFSTVLGRRSDAWELWNLTYEQLRDAPVRAGRQVTAGKLLCAKRPQLLPIFDSQVGRALRVTNNNVWHAVWYVLQDEQARLGLESLRHEVVEAKDRSLVRVLDIVAWKDGAPRFLTAGG